MSIHPILEKIKALALKAELTDILMILIIVLVGLAGFGIGRLSTEGQGKAIIIQTGGEQTASPSTQNLASANVSSESPQNITGIVASKNGTKYYLPGCSGSGRIQDQNKVYFNTEQEAIDAGYAKANGCN